MIPRPLVIHFLIASMPLALMLIGLEYSYSDPDELYAFFREHRNSHGELKQFMYYITHWANPVMYVVYSLLLIIAWRAKDGGLKRLCGSYLTVQILVSLLLVRLLKYVFGLPRPGTDELCLPYSPAPSCHAMPSGHTVEAVNQTLPLALGVKNVFFSLAMGLYAASIAFTRIYLGQHHAGDVLFGWLIGAWGGCLIYALWKKAV